MRRLVPILLAALLTVLMVTPVAAGKPEKIPNEPITQSFDAECGFDAELADYYAAGSVKIYQPKKNGESRLQSNGGFRSILHSTDSGKTLDLSFFGRLKFVFHGDGTVTVRQSGEALWWFSDPADGANFGVGRGVYIFDGHIEAELDENFVSLAPATMKNVTIRDLCAELAPED